MFVTLDINECIEMANNCTQNQLCVNTEGGFTCECKPGFRSHDGGITCQGIISHFISNRMLLSQNIAYYTVNSNARRIIILLRLISDIDECTEGLSSCSQVCTNTTGSYTCSCHPGYTLNADSSTCSLNGIKLL